MTTPRPEESEFSYVDKTSGQLTSFAAKPDEAMVTFAPGPGRRSTRSTGSSRIRRCCRSARATTWSGASPPSSSALPAWPTWRLRTRSRTRSR
ncbi:hypothetical protein ACFQ0B_68060 [Nonomuraea thailandensis]